VDLLNTILNTLFRALLFPFRNADPVWGLVWLSLITAVGALLVYRYFSRQEAIREVKERLKAHILEMRLFQHDPVLTGRAVLSVLRCNLRYLRLNLKPFLFMFVPVVLVLIQMEARYGYRPLGPGDTALVRTFWKTAPDPLPNQAPLLAVSGGLAVDSPALRIPSSGEVDWRISATGEGSASLAIRSGGQVVRVPVTVSPGLVPVSPWNGAPGSLDMLWNPAAHPLPDTDNLLSVDIGYPRRDFRFLGFPVYWMWPYFILTLVAGYLLKGLFGVHL